jgi:hypothetical protein
MVLGRMTSGPTLEEETRLKETDREAERVQAMAEFVVEPASRAPKARHSLLERIRGLFRGS